MPDAYSLASNEYEDWMEGLKNEISLQNKPCNHCGCRAEKEIKEVFHNNLDEIKNIFLDTYRLSENEIALIYQFVEFIKTKV